MDRSPLPSISLYSKKDGADKEYHAKVVEVVGGYSVQTRHGKRGAAKEPKTVPPVLSFTEAIKEFEKIIKEKKSPKKGYTEDVSGFSYTDSSLQGTYSGNSPHLLVPITYQKLFELATDDRWGFQEKMNGERLMLDRAGTNVITSNKQGCVNTVPQQIVDNALQQKYDDILLDGENIRGVYYVFDILRYQNRSLSHLSAEERYAIYSGLETASNIVKVPMHFGTADKLSFLENIANKTGTEIVEGVVAKLLSAPYQPGRASPTNATQFKYKYVSDLSCVVLDVHRTKRSVSIGVVQDNRMRNIGNVGIPVNHLMPSVNDIIDVQYRHLFANGDLCEPVFLKARQDVMASECVIEQISRILENTVQLEDTQVESTN